MKIDLFGLAEGLRNKYWPKEELIPLITQTKGERMAICSTCPHNSLNKGDSLRPDAHCTKCGCNLDLKTQCLSCACPINNWKAVVTQEEDATIKQRLNDNI